jgi:hypothetical protein
MEAKYYKNNPNSSTWVDFIKVTDKKELITIWSNGEINIQTISGNTIRPEYTESTRTEFEMAKLKLINYIEQL